MKSKKAVRSALGMSVLSIALCAAMLIGTTFAWFTDTASTAVNKIQAGTLDVALEMKDGDNWVSAEGKTLDFVKSPEAPTGEELLWEPGCTYNLPELKIVNNGNLALKYKVVVSGVNGNSKLLEAIEFKVKVGEKDPVALADLEGILLPKGKSPVVDSEKVKESESITISGHMKETAGNEYQGLSIDGIAITVYATQYIYEYDSNGKDYDENATYYPVLDAAGLKDALVNGGNIRVDSDVVPTETLVVEKNTTLDMNGSTIANETDLWNDADGVKTWSLISARGAGLTIDGNGTFQAKKDDCYAVDVQDGANVVIENGTFIGNIHAVYVLEGTLTVKGGFFAVQQKYPDATKANEFVLNCYDANYKAQTASIVVTGGTFVNFNPANCKAEGEGTNFVADGYSVVSEKHGNDTWYTVVKGTGAGSQDDLNTAIDGKTEATVTLTKSGTYTLPSLNGKDVTVVGTKDTVIDMKNELNNGATNIAFEGVTVQFGTSNYRGFQHTGKLTYKDCTINGLQFLYADEVEFINCTFDQDNDDSYHIWTYGAKDVTFTDCTFNSTAKSKAVLCYIEGGGQTLTRTFNNCTFTATGTAEKSAIMVNPTANAGAVNTYVVNINNCTATGYAENGIDGQTIVGVKETVKDNITINIDGTTVYTH